MLLCKQNSYIHLYLIKFVDYVIIQRFISILFIKGENNESL